MRRINIAACSLMLMALASAPAMAQGNRGGGGGRMDPAQMAQRTSDRLLTGITLTAAQTASIKTINEHYATDAKAAMGGDDMRAKMTELRTKQRTDIRAVLTADQQATFDKNVADMEKARGSRQRQ